MMDLRIVPDVLSDRPACAVATETSVFDASRQMRDMRVSAGMVIGPEDSLEGLITERDIVRRLVAEGLDAATTPVSAIMRPPTDHLAPGDLAIDAVDLMDIRDVECLPVIEGDELLGLVTRTDLCAVLRREMEISLDAAQDDAFRPDSGEG